jgi:hypothetical protein
MQVTLALHSAPTLLATSDAERGVPRAIGSMGLLV